MCGTVHSSNVPHPEVWFKVENILETDRLRFHIFGHHSPVAMGNTVRGWPVVSSPFPFPGSGSARLGQPGTVSASFKV